MSTSRVTSFSALGRTAFLEPWLLSSTSAQDAVEQHVEHIHLELPSKQMARNRSTGASSHLDSHRIFSRSFGLTTEASSVMG